MHGGTFVNLAHGGIVAPGYSNDGMMVNVSSGEQLEVTPAGNKDITESALLAEMQGLRADMEALPLMLRDAVMLAR